LANYTVTGEGTAKTLNDNDVLTVTVTGVINTPGSAVLMQDYLGSVLNAGTLACSYGGAIEARAGYQRIVNSGTIGGATGIELSPFSVQPGGNSIVNTGSITGTTSRGIIIGSGGNTISNSGTISSQLSEAIVIGSGFSDEGYYLDNLIVNSGLITANFSFFVSAAIKTYANADTVLNSGTIRGGLDLGNGTNTANNTGWIVGNVVTGTGSDTVVNHGTLDGNITLGDGADRFDGRDGDLNGHVAGGLGDDVYVIDDATTIILEDYLDVPNADRVESSVSFTLLSNIEELTLTGTAHLRGIGNDGRNVLTSNSGNSTLQGRGGDDLILGGLGDERLDGGFGNDVIYAAEGDDTANGGAGNDLLTGFLGDDFLRGGAGNDTLHGEQDNDTLLGGDGADSMTGGAGLDVFLFVRPSEATSAAQDRITDFTRGEDLIDLSTLDGTLAYRGTGAYVAGGAQMRIVAGGNTQLLIDLNGDNTTDMKIILTGNINLQAADFIL
jgi:hypothetical protein